MCEHDEDNEVLPQHVVCYVESYPNRTRITLHRISFTVVSSSWKRYVELQLKLCMGVTFLVPYDTLMERQFVELAKGNIKLSPYQQCIVTV